MTKDAAPTSPPSILANVSVSRPVQRTNMHSLVAVATASPSPATAFSRRSFNNEVGQYGALKSDSESTLDIALTTAQVNDVLDKVNLPSLPSHLPSLSEPSKVSHVATEAVYSSNSFREAVSQQQVPKLPSTISIPSPSMRTVPVHEISTKSEPMPNQTATTSSTIKPTHSPDRHLSASMLALSTPSRPKSSKQESGSSGRWTLEEHEAFLAGLKVFGREWKKVAQRIPTRTSAQIRSHAQKYFAKLARDEQQQATVWKAVHVAVPNTIVPQGTELSSSVMERVEKILKDPESAQKEVEETLRRLRNRYGELQRRRIENHKKPSSQASLPVSTDKSGSAWSYIESSSSIGSLSDPMTCALEYSQNIVEGRVEQRSESFSSGKPQASRKRALSEIPEPQRQKKIKEGDEALASKELIALHVLGGALYRSASRENLEASEVIHSRGSSVGPPESPEAKLDSSPINEKKKSPTD